MGVFFLVCDVRRVKGGCGEGKDSVCIFHSKGNGLRIVEVRFDNFDALGLEREGGGFTDVAGDGSNGVLGRERASGEDVGDDGGALLAGRAKDDEELFGHRGGN